MTDCIRRIDTTTAPPEVATLAGRCGDPDLNSSGLRVTAANFVALDSVIVSPGGETLFVGDSNGVYSVDTSSMRVTCLSTTAGDGGWFDPRTKWTFTDEVDIQLCHP